MPRPQRPWFRFYVEAVTDAKLRRFTPAQRWLWVCVLAAARESPISGLLMLPPDVPMMASDLARMSDLSERVVKTTLTDFERLGMVTDGPSGWEVLHWKERQYETDNTTERTRKHRSQERGRNVPTMFPGTSLPLLAENREQSTEAAASNSFTHNGSAADPAAAASDLIEKALNLLVDRRIATSKRPVENLVAYRAAALAGLRKEHADDLYPITVTEVDWTPAQLADFLEPPAPAPKRLQGLRDDRPDCEECAGAGMVLDDANPPAARPCSSCR